MEFTGSFAKITTPQARYSASAFKETPIRKGREDISGSTTVKTTSRTPLDIAKVSFSSTFTKTGTGIPDRDRKEITRVVSEFPEFLHLNPLALANASIYIYTYRDNLDNFYERATSLNLLKSLTIRDNSGRDERTTIRNKEKAATTLLRYVLFIINKNQEALEKHKQITSQSTTITIGPPPTRFSPKK